MLFILGHMRSGSSLLTHILSSNAAIDGYGETHLDYSNPQDFGVATANVCRHLWKVPSGEYVLDKVLHKRHIPRSELLKHPSVRVIDQVLNCV